MRPNVPTPALRQARLQLLEHGLCPPGLVAEPIARSWQRSLAAGLQPTGRLDAASHTSGQDLRQALARNHDLLAHSRPVMEYLFEQVRHSQSVVVLADGAGVLMHTLGDPDFMTRAERVALSCGAAWGEAQRGTNAIGTALAEGCAVEVHGAEHFLERNGFLTCAAAPILSAQGALMGILDISGDHRQGHPHTLGLVSTAARMIENRLLTASHRRHLRLHLHAQPEGIGTVAEGLVLLSEDGWIMGANRQGMALLRLSTADLQGTPLASVADTRMEALLAHHRRQPGDAQPLRLHDGRLLFAQLHADARTLMRPVAAAASEPRPALRAATASAPHDALAALDTGDARWAAAADKARRIMGKPIALLIQGESGVGKELFARAVHDSGPRRQGPFVTLNCAALPEGLIEAELFGYAPGAYTGARRDGRMGQLRAAQGGTLFLDEIGDMPLTLQTRLLRVLQERMVQPLGGGEPVALDFALICASHRSLKDEAATGRFRSDLYYRINGLTVQLPALRERSDLPALTRRLLDDLAPDEDLQIAPGLMAALHQHPWPGNLRQYASVLRTACAMRSPGEHELDWPHLADDIAEDLRAPARPGTARPTSATPDTAPRNLQELSRQAIRQTLQTRRGNVSQAARDLGISRQTLYRKLREDERD